MQDKIYIPKPQKLGLEFFTLLIEYYSDTKI